MRGKVGGGGEEWGGNLRCATCGEMWASPQEGLVLNPM